MLGYVIKRILGVIPVAATVVTFVFLLLRLSPTDPASLIAGESATQEDIERCKNRHENPYDSAHCPECGKRTNVTMFLAATVAGPVPL